MGKDNIETELTPEEAAKKAERKAARAAMSPEQRAERKAARGNKSPEQGAGGETKKTPEQRAARKAKKAARAR